VVAHTYFGIRQKCLRSLEGLEIQHKSEGGRENRIVTSDPYGDNLVKTVLPGSKWTYHHDEINQQIHIIVRQSDIISQLEIEDYFVHKLTGMGITPKDSMPITSKHIKGYIRSKWKADGDCMQSVPRRNRRIHGG